MALKISDDAYQTAALMLGCEIDAIKAVAQVESMGSGFLVSGRPKILFEGHYFHRLTGGKFSIHHPTISYKKWTKKFYYGGEKEWLRLEKARGLDGTAADQSTSWGAFQIMGENYRACGFNNVGQFVQAMMKDEAEHLYALCHLLLAPGWGKALKGIRTKDWRMFAARYNGPAYEENFYHIKLASAYKELSNAHAN